MADPTTQSASAATTGQSQAGTGASQEQLTSLISSMQDLQTQFRSLTENVNKISSAVEQNANFQTTAQGVFDPYENLRRDRVIYDHIAGVNLKAFENFVENQNALSKQFMQHDNLSVAGHWRVPSAGDSVPTSQTAAAAAKAA